MSWNPKCGSSHVLLGKKRYKCTVKVIRHQFSVKCSSLWRRPRALDSKKTFGDINIVQYADANSEIKIAKLFPEQEGKTILFQSSLLDSFFFCITFLMDRQDFSVNSSLFLFNRLSLHLISAAYFLLILPNYKFQVESKFYLKRGPHFTRNSWFPLLWRFFYIYIFSYLDKNHNSAVCNTIDPKRLPLKQLSFFNQFRILY